MALAVSRDQLPVASKSKVASHKVNLYEAPVLARLIVH